MAELCGSEDDDFAHWQATHRRLEVMRAQQQPAHVSGYRRQRRKRGYQAFPSKRGKRNG